jgi:cytochrome b pre-mRNA-processing protein 3
MLSYLFPRLTPQRGTALFGAVTGRARQPHWYVEGKVPDTLDGRFGVLATIVALVVVRLEQLGDEGEAASVALTERFIEAMETDHRELGLGDPTLGKTVRKLVGALGRRVELWRSAVDGDWEAAAAESLKGGDPRYCAEAFRTLWADLGRRDGAELLEGRLQ